jgi:hypothetical protein
MQTPTHRAEYWYYESPSGHPTGPMTVEQIKMLAKVQHITPGTMIRRADQRRWTAYSVLEEEGVFGVKSTEPPPAPAPSIQVSQDWDHDPALKQKWETLRDAPTPPPSTNDLHDDIDWPEGESRPKSRRPKRHKEEPDYSQEAITPRHGTPADSGPHQSQHKIRPKKQGSSTTKVIRKSLVASWELLRKHLGKKSSPGE